MNIDDPKKPEFASWRSYQEFTRRVRHTHRYVWGKEVQAFLDTVLVTPKNRRARPIPAGAILYRAQEGIDYDPVVNDDGKKIGEEPHGYGAQRMKPLVNRAREGRANPAGIPMLYLASTKQTAISEVRPWIGSEISVAQFKVLRELRAIDLSLGHGQMSIGDLTLGQLIDPESLDAETKEKIVWIDIDNAFSQPITRSDDAADYVPTQILTELFRDAGYDAIIYRSQFGKEGYNIALFNVDDAEFINCTPYQVTGIDISFETLGSMSFPAKGKASTD